jgi:hypothetical protein
MFVKAVVLAGFSLELSCLVVRRLRMIRGSSRDRAFPWADVTGEVVPRSLQGSAGARGSREAFAS